MGGRRGELALAGFQVKVRQKYVFFLLSSLIRNSFHFISFLSLISPPPLFPSSPRDVTLTFKKGSISLFLRIARSGGGSASRSALEGRKWERVILPLVYHTPPQSISGSQQPHHSTDTLPSLAFHSILSLKGCSVMCFGHYTSLFVLNRISEYLDFLVLLLLMDLFNVNNTELLLDDIFIFQILLM